LATLGLLIMLLLNNMELVVLFGLPGAGKTFIGKLLQKEFGFYFYEGDNDMPQELKDAIVNETVTDRMRNNFFTVLISRIKALQNTHNKVVLSQTFIKEKYRRQFLAAFPQAKFIYIDAETSLRESRLLHRDRFRLSLEKWQKMSAIFEKPQIKHETIQNNNEGEETLRKQLQLLLR
jgi:gluconokinase